MKTKQFKPALAALLLLSTLNPQLSTVFAQGSLTPPGAPAPTMKTLAQIEPRTPISSAPYTISSPGSYYLTTNLTVASGNAITIATNGVTLDLGGFTIASTAPSATGFGILLNSGLRDSTICNGHIRGGVTNNGSGTYNGSGFSSGICSLGTPMNCRVSGVSVSGCMGYGIFLVTGDSTVVESCTVRTVGGYGIYASTVKNSVAIDCGGCAIYGDQVSDCRGQCTRSSDGIRATTAQNCYGQSNSGDGVTASTAQNCYGSSSSGIGLSASVAQNCYGASGGSGPGINAYVAIGCYCSTASGFDLTGFICNSCYLAGTGTTSITHKYNMP